MAEDWIKQLLLFGRPDKAFAAQLPFYTNRPSATAAYYPAFMTMTPTEQQNIAASVHPMWPARYVPGEYQLDQPVWGSASNRGVEVYGPERHPELIPAARHELGHIALDPVLRGNPLGAELLGAAIRNWPTVVGQYIMQQHGGTEPIFRAPLPTINGLHEYLASLAEHQWVPQRMPILPPLEFLNSEYTKDPLGVLSRIMSQGVFPTVFPPSVGLSPLERRAVSELSQ